ncbi:MAG: T9SS type A sorting domain-containing protein [Bacteroidota bacterium]
MRYFLYGLTTLLSVTLSAQLPYECQLDFGVNMAGMADFGTELPFVDLMKNAREWYTKDVGNPNAAFDSEQALNLSYRADGYPTHAPQQIPESPYPQEVVTIWGNTKGWPAGEYTLLWEGSGTLRLVGSFSNLTTTGTQRMTFDLTPQEEGIVELTIAVSELSNPIRNIRLLIPGTEATYQDQPFNPVFIHRLQEFGSVRFMDWGQTNNWGQARGEGWNNPHLFDWSERSQMDHYTWAYDKGIPYEVMIQLMNDYELDGWLCVPHRASDDYLHNLAAYFRDNLSSDRHLTVEYSNEIWNWIFGQTNWLYEYGCVQNNLTWPEGIAPYVQNCLDHFTTAFSGQLHRITRVVGTQLSWLDVSQRIVNQLTPGSFDAISPTCYFGLTEAGDAALDQLASTATAADVAFHAREGITQNFAFLREQKEHIADPLGIPIVFYEGGQHLTPHPFGVMPSYEQALLAIQRDEVMYQLYQSWFDSLRTLQTGEQPLQIMHFSFVANRSAQFGSWGMLETMDQDLNQIPAPKYQAVIDNKAQGENCQSILAVEWDEYEVQSTNCTATIRWQTTQETNNDYFVIQKSQDGEHFQTVTTIDGTNANEGARYIYQDTQVNSGHYYYRILQYDFDGSQTTLGVRQLRVVCDQTTTLLRIYPNPAHQLLRVQSNVPSSGQIQVFDLTGRLLLKQKHERLDQIELPVAHLKSGAYVLELRPRRGQVTRKRFVVQP